MISLKLWVNIFPNFFKTGFNAKLGVFTNKRVDVSLKQFL